MSNSIENWMFDPTICKIAAVMVGIIIIVIFIRFLKKSIRSRINDTDSRYRFRKVVSFMDYIFGITMLITLFSDKLSGFSVALEIAGAGIAFAFQELIASIAG